MNTTFDWMGAHELIWDAPLDRRDRFVLLAIHKHMNNSTNIAWPSYERLQKLTGYRRPALAKSIRRLEEMGFIRRSKRTVSGKQYPGNIYEFCYPADSESWVSRTPSKQPRRLGGSGSGFETNHIISGVSKLAIPGTTPNIVPQLYSSPDDLYEWDEDEEMETT